MPDITHPMHRPARRRILERLAHVPRPPELLCSALQITARHVERNRIPEDMLQRLVGGDILATGFQTSRHFDLEVHVIGLARIGKHAINAQVVGIFLKEERRLPVRIVPHLARMLGIIAPDAVNAMHRKDEITAHDRQCGDRDRRESIGHRAGSLASARHSGALWGGAHRRAPTLSRPSGRRPVWRQA